MRMHKILIIEDDPQISKALQLNLKLSGFEIEASSLAHEGWQKLKTQHFDLLLMDVGLPDGNGLDLCQKIRESGDNTPILFLSARTDESTVVKAINHGADDYIRKPFGIEELKVRINKILKKFSVPTTMIHFEELTIDPNKRIVTVMNQIVNLGRKEMEILILLARRAGDIVTRDNILETLYESADMYDRTIDSHMSHLRKKLKEITGQALQINSVYGLGYRLEWNHPK